MNAFSLNISGVDKIKKAIEAVDTKLTDGMSKEISASVLTIQRTAARNAPGNFGKLKGSFQVDIKEPLFKKVFSTVNYAPYVEFGTKGNARIPAGYEQFAAQYKGKKAAGPAVDFYKAIELWVKRKGIDPKLTYVIFRSIMRNGIKPQPFMIPAYEMEKPNLIKRLKRLFK